MLRQVKNENSLLPVAVRRSLTMSSCAVWKPLTSSSFFFCVFLADNEHLLSGQLDDLASSVSAAVFETDEIPFRDIVRLVNRN